MNTTKGSPLGINNEAARNQLEVKLILAVLWVAGMLSSLNGDTYRLNDPVLKSSLANIRSFVMTPELLSIAALMFVGSIFMSV